MSKHTQELHTSMRWAAEELATAQFGDQRLRTRLIQIVAAKLANPRATIPQASQTWAATKATYNFFASQQVSADAIRAAHLHATRSRLANHHTLGVVQDTTELDYSSHRHTSGLGYLDTAYSSGVKVHSALAISTAGVPLGLVYQNVWSRDAATKGQKRRKLAQHERESQRWLTTLEQVQQAIAAPTRLIVVADREAAIYPLFIAPREERTDLLIRAAYNRGVSGGQNVEQVVEQVEWQGSHTVELPGTGQRASRNATLQIGWSSVEIHPPTDYSKRASAPRSRLQLVVVEEREPPAGVTPLGWLLWTTMELTSWEEAVQVVETYKKRWLIERYHYVLKSGCGIEQLQLQSSERLERALAVCCIVAWRLMWLTYEAREQPKEPCTSALARHEWQALYCTVHQTPIPLSQPPTLHAAVGMIAREAFWLAKATANQE